MYQLCKHSLVIRIILRNQYPAAWYFLNNLFFRVFKIHKLPVTLTKWHLYGERYSKNGPNSFFALYLYLSLKHLNDLLAQPEAQAGASEILTYWIIGLYEWPEQFLFVYLWNSDAAIFNVNFYEPPRFVTWQTTLLLIKSFKVISWRKVFIWNRIRLVCTDGAVFNHFSLGIFIAYIHVFI